MSQCVADPYAWVPTLLISAFSLLFTVVVVFWSQQSSRSSRQELTLYFQDKSYNTQAGPQLDTANVRFKEMAKKAMTDQWKDFDATYGYNYALYFLVLSDEVERLDISQLRRSLQEFWQSTFTLKDSSSLPSDFFAKAQWLSRARAYRSALEPIDIANYYRSGFDRDSGEYFESDNRPKQYKDIEDLEKSNNGFDGDQRKELINRLKALREQTRKNTL